MQSRFMNVYYGVDRLPYKDEKREVHYPNASGNIITGENNTTKIYFYVGLIGGSQRQWIANIKKPDGTLFYQLCTNGQSVGSDYRVELDIASLYADQVGDVYIGLQGYSGETVIVEDEGTYEISGNPIVLATGTIKIKVNYAPSVLPKGETLSPTAEQLILSALSGKIDKESSILVVDTLPEDTTKYQDGQIVFERQSMKFNEYFNEEFTTIDLTNYDKVYTIDEINNFLSQKQETLVSGENLKTVNGESLLGSGDLTITIPVSSVNGKTGAVVLNATDIKLTTNQTTVQQNIIRIDEEISRVEGKFDGLIPSEASVSNKLADKNFVNSSIATNTANYIYKIVDNEKVPFNSLQELESQTALTPTLNDYAFVVSTDSEGNVVYNRYKYTSEGWAFEYALNNSSFTASQWSAINSGISSGKVAQYDGYNSLINALNTRVGSVEASLTKNGIETLLGESWTQIEIDEE